MGAISGFAPGLVSDRRNPVEELQVRMKSQENPIGPIGRNKARRAVGLAEAGPIRDASVWVVLRESRLGA